MTNVVVKIFNNINKMIKKFTGNNMQIVISLGKWPTNPPLLVTVFAANRSYGLLSLYKQFNFSIE